MGNLVTLLSIEPPARYDGVPWTVVHLLEAATPEVAGAVIDTQALPAPIDADPTDPAARNVSSSEGTLDIGWYRPVFEDAAGGVSPPGEPVRSSVLAAQLPPSPEQIRNRSPLLRQKFPEPATDPEQASDLRAAVYGATGQVMALSWRVIDPTLGCAAPEDYVCEVVPDALVEVALQAITAMSERRAVLADPEIAEQIGTGRRLRGFTAGPYCVPMDTEALTDRGWRSYGDLCVGDMVLGYDAGAGVARWTPITNIIAPMEADVVRVGVKRWGLRCTAEHRWLVRDRPTGQSYEAGQWGDWEMRAASELVGRRDFDLMLTCPASTDQQLEITPAEAALVAWLWTDGHVEQRQQGETHKPFIRGTIYQKHYREHVEGLLEDVGVPHTVVVDPRDEEYSRYRLRSPWLRGLWERAQLDSLSPVQFVLALGDEAREAFLEAGLLAEGSLPRSTQRRPERAPGGRWYRWHFAQNEGPVLDAFVLAAHLCGYGARVWNSLSRCKGFLLGRAFHSGQSVRVRPDGREMVWCVQTELGSWTIRQGNTIALTGNSETYFAPGEFARRGVQSRPQFDQDDTVDSLLWDLATEDAKDYLVFRTSGTPLPSGLATTFDYRRASIGYRAGDDGYGGGGFARGGPDGL